LDYRCSGLEIVNADLSAKEVSSLICNWLTSVQELGEMIVDGLFAALEVCGRLYPCRRDCRAHR
jgi:hypothetical protein